MLMLLHLRDTGSLFHIRDTGSLFHLRDTGSLFHLRDTGSLFYLRDTGSPGSPCRVSRVSISSACVAHFCLLLSYILLFSCPSYVEKPDGTYCIIICFCGQ